MSVLEARRTDFGEIVKKEHKASARRISAALWESRFCFTGFVSATADFCLYQSVNMLIELHG
jgi:hypothetical protein